ncbi:MAG: adenosine kinase [Hyphomicrobiaceae bacterium]|nr:adenosine kinase [Hyphomicrobiaceae bacterium]MCC0023875.1 adenosine kinase [Hyphomicrobiaceae bacterium]
MSQPRLDLLTIGNAITDIFAQVDDEFLAAEGMTKAIMHLIEHERANYLWDRMPANKKQRSGGSTANSAVGVAALGGTAAFVGKVAEDEIGHFYISDMHSEGVEFTTPMLSHGAGSGRSMILITPDGERTMNTYLGACHDLTEEDIIEDQIAEAATIFMEGYLWDPPEAKLAFVRAAHYAHKHERAAAITLSDPFCVDRFRDEFRDLIRSKTCDYVFANIEELKSLYQTSDFSEAVRQIASEAELAVITLGEDGAMAVQDGEVVSVPAHPVREVIDLTGAGDLFASGFLLGHARGAPLDVSLRLGCLCAAEVIEHVGARPDADLKELAAAHGLSVI